MSFDNNWKPIEKPGGVLPKEKPSWFWSNFVGIVLCGVFIFVGSVTMLLYYSVEAEFVEVFGSKQDPSCEEIEEKFVEIKSKLIKSVVSKLYIERCTELTQNEEEVMNMLENGP